MADLVDLIAANAILHRVKFQNKTDLLQALVETAHTAYGVDISSTIESTIERERLGSTGIGDGVAIPHARVKGILVPAAVLAVLETGIDFDAPDGRAADIVVLLLSPDEAGADHLKALAKLSRLLRKSEVREGIRAARSATAVHALTSHHTGQHKGQKTGSVAA